MTFFYDRLVTSKVCSLKFPFGKGTSLALYASGRPRISYVAYRSEPGTPFVNGDLRYAWKDASGWHTGTTVRVIRVLNE